MTKVDLFKGNCLIESEKIKDKSVDLILTDLPYGVLNKRTGWDVIIPFDKMWQMVDRILKPNGAFITTSKQPFTSQLIMSNLKDFRYTLVWEKSKSTGWLNSKKCLWCLTRI